MADPPDNPLPIIDAIASIIGNGNMSCSWFHSRRHGPAATTRKRIFPDDFPARPYFELPWSGLDLPAKV
jgi:hypothetical protein